VEGPGCTVGAALNNVVGMFVESHMVAVGMAIDSALDGFAVPALVRNSEPALAVYIADVRIVPPAAAAAAAVVVEDIVLAIAGLPDTLVRKDSGRQRAWYM
jgi:hypothetical protein